MKKYGQEWIFENSCRESILKLISLSFLWDSEIWLYCTSDQMDLENFDTVLS